MDYIKDPKLIETKSMEIIAPYIEKYNLDAATAKVYSRIIHASGDVEYAPFIRLHKEAIERAKTALKKGADIYTDVEMVKTGINKKRLARYGGTVRCIIGDDKTRELAESEHITRAIAAMRIFGKNLDGAIVAIGNAPTALFEVLRLVKEKNILPAVIVGIPVGFVGAADSKKLLAENDKVPFITVEGTKGGSPIAAAAVNAILYDME